MSSGKVDSVNTKVSEAASLLGKLSYKARLRRFGIERLREIARKNGAKGGRPKGSGKKDARR